MLKRALRLMTAALLVAGVAATAYAQPIELKVSHHLPPNHAPQKVLEAWSEQLDQKSGGRLEVRSAAATSAIMSKRAASQPGSSSTSIASDRV